jgi:hypothetical protein
MRPALDRDDPQTRLRLLIRRWRAEELTLRAELALLADELENASRVACWNRSTHEDMTEAGRRRCIGLQEQADAVAIELAHVRLALIGATEELGWIREATEYGPALAS